MFIDPNLILILAPFEGADWSFCHPGTAPLLRTEPDRSFTAFHKHFTPNRGETWSLVLAEDWGFVRIKTILTRATRPPSVTF